jgi:hypothetical protein
MEERIQINARRYKEQYEEVLKIPDVGDKWQLDDKGTATVASTELLLIDVLNYSEKSKIYMYDFYKIALDNIQLKAEYEEEREEIETEVIVYTIAPEYRFDEDIKEIVKEVYNKSDRMQEEFEDLEEFEDSLDECDNNTEILQALASKIGKRELTEIVVHYDYHLEWAINQILK